MTFAEQSQRLRKKEEIETVLLVRDEMGNINIYRNLNVNIHKLQFEVDYGMVRWNYNQCYWFSN